MKTIRPISPTKRKRVISSLAALSIMLAGQSYAHSGGLDSSGCHGGSEAYHCHRGSSGGGSSGLSSDDWQLLGGLLLLGLIISVSEDSSQGNKSTKSIPVDRTDIVEILQSYSGQFSDESAAMNKLIEAGFTQKQFNRIHDPDVQVWINLVLSR